MIVQLTRKLLQAIPVLFIMSFIVFSLAALVPGDPVLIMLGEEADPASAERIRGELGLDRHFIVQYALWVGRVLRGNLGESIYFGQPVTELITSRLEATFVLAVPSFLLAVVMGTSMGIVSAVLYNRLGDRLLMGLAVIGFSIPNFLFALALILVFAVHLRALPSSGYTSIFSDPGNAWQHLVLPTITLGTAHAATLARMSRAYFLEVLTADYIRTARAKGNNELMVLLKHALKNSLVPLVAVMSVSLSVLFGGAIVTETVFAIPGVGRLLVSAVVNRDFPVVTACILLIASLYVVINVLSDAINIWIDPRIRY